jgi:TetR/AcrR family transcriptional regulator, repressor for uid operon
MNLHITSNYEEHYITQNKSIWHSNNYLNHQREKGFFRKNININAIASGLVALYDGLTISKLLGINENYNKKAWTETIRAIFTGIN